MARKKIQLGKMVSKNSVSMCLQVRSILRLVIHITFVLFVWGACTVSTQVGWLHALWASVYETVLSLLLCYFLWRERPGSCSLWFGVDQIMGVTNGVGDRHMLCFFSVLTSQPRSPPSSFFWSERRPGVVYFWLLSWMWQAREIQGNAIPLPCSWGITGGFVERLELSLDWPAEKQ